MMETFIVLGLCFILYEALDFFQGCMHSVQPTATDQIDAYRRQLEEQRAQQQQEQFLANLSPLLGAQILAATQAATGGGSSSISTTPTASTASVISDLRLQHQRELDNEANSTESRDHSVSTPALNGGIGVSGGGSGGFRPAYRGFLESTAPQQDQEQYFLNQQNAAATSSLPRDYYYVQQQQLKNKNSSKSLLSKLSSNSIDNRIYPETAPSILGVSAGVITQQPTSFNHHPSALGGSSGSPFDCLPPPLVVPASPPLVLNLKRAILCSSSSNINNNNNNIHKAEATVAQEQQQLQLQQLHIVAENLRNKKSATASARNCDDSDCEDSASTSSASSSSASSESASAGSASLVSCAYASDDEDADDEQQPHEAQKRRSADEERDFAATSGGSCSSSHTDFREIECERLRRKCVSVKRIYSISEKF